MESSGPKRAGPVLATLILVAGVANLNLAVANVALPDIGQAFDAGQTTVDLIAVGYSLGLAASVLYLGAVGDRYGRKRMLVLGMALSIPASILAGFAPSATVLFIARVLGGVAAGMAYPTTLALITALWSGRERTKAIALWSALGGGASALGPLLAGALLEGFEWGSVFLVSAPLAAIALYLVWRLVPAHVNETTDPVDHFSGILSIGLVAALVLAINLAPEPGKGTAAIVLGAVALAATAAFLLRQRRIAFPLYDLKIAARSTFWVAACAGIVVFGSLMGAMFIGQQFVQNVLGYSTLEAGLAILPGAAGMILVAPRSARLVESHGSRFTLLLGFGFCLLAFAVMLLLWDEDASYLMVGLGYLLVGIGVGFAGTPASRSLTGSVPVTRAGMASGTADLQRDLGGAIMQSIFGALLTAGYAAGFATQIASSPEAAKVSERVQNELTKSFSSAANTAEQYPQYAPQIVDAARTSFLDGGDWTYAAGMIAIALGMAVVFFLFPKRDEELGLLERYHGEDAAAAANPPAAPLVGLPRHRGDKSPGRDNPTMAYRLLRAAEAHWRPSNQMSVHNTDLAKQLGASALGARLWRLAPGQASTKHRHATQEELYVLLEGSGRVRVGGGGPLTLQPLDSLLVEPASVRQLFNDTDADQLWLVVGAPAELADTLEMSAEQLRELYPDGPKALPPELDG